MASMHNHSHNSYSPPLALTVISGVFLALGAVCLLIVAIDIVWRRGWKSMMGVMIPVYIINAGYMLPVTLWLYFKYGRPTAPSELAKGSGGPSCHSSSPASNPDDQEQAPQQQPNDHSCHQPDATSPPNDSDSNAPPSNTTSTADADPEKAQPSHDHHDHASAGRPMYVTVLAGVSHCGAGCVLGDLVGEWLVYGTGATLGGEMIWAELLIDYAFALLFGILFQYFSIAPMSGQYGPGTVWRAAKADILSLTSFEVGLFGWMVIYQVGIFNYGLAIDTWTYWWMMQVGMVLGFATAAPVNWWLISKGIKEPCA